VTAAWVVVSVVGAATFVLRAAGPVLLGGRELPPRILGVITLVAPALLAALVVTAAVGGNRELVVDARLVGLGAGAAAILFRAPLLAVLIVSATATAVVRAVF
jgi:branched-subunit amino acid transport protein